MLQSMNRRSNASFTSDDFYKQAITLANKSQIPYLIGGAFAYYRYTGIYRDTKDLDLFVKPDDCLPLLQFYADQGFRTELTFPHWLGKVYCGDYFIDLIFSSGNGVATVDDEWFDHAEPGALWGVNTLLIPPAEMIWSKSFVMERERFDGADVAHILRFCGERLDWPRLLRRFDENWRVLLSHLVLYGYVYPHETNRVPAEVMEELTRRLSEEGRQPASKKPVCRGTMLSREQYLADIGPHGLHDARLAPGGFMSPGDIALWTEAIQRRD
jgi:hypothetical protein